MENEVIKGESNFNNPKQNSRVWTGIFLLACGSVLLASKMGAPIPDWIIGWETLLIALGLLIGIRSQFHNPGAFILLFIGGASLIDNHFPQLSIRNYIWPVFIILMGIYFLLQPNKRKRQKAWSIHEDLQKKIQDDIHQKINEDIQNKYYPSNVHPAEDYNASVSSESMLDVTAVFGSVKKKLISKTFRGGDITAFLGGVEIDLTGADIQTTAVLDVSAVFGGIKLIIPSDWKVQNKATAVFGGVEDKRAMPASFSNKVLVIDGTAVFGGIELKSY